jgi:hypothetical protein
MTNKEHEAGVCDFVREILEQRTGESLAISGFPDTENRPSQAVEQLWDGPSHRYAVEHTRIESYTRQIENNTQIERLLLPVRQALESNLPGTFVLSVRAGEVKLARSKHRRAQEEMIRLILSEAVTMGIDEKRLIQSPSLPFSFALHRRHALNSTLLLHCLIEGDSDGLRIERVKRALADKCPKLLSTAKVDNRTSVLILESDDFQLANAFAIFAALNALLPTLPETPDIIVLVETDGSPWFGHVLKEGAMIGNVPAVNGKGPQYQRAWARSD